MTKNQLDEETINSIICGDASEVLQGFPSEAINCVITSPPYYGQRDYGSDKQVGNEANLSDYVERLLGVFHELYRVLSEEGTFWLNIGDKYKNGQLLGIPWSIAHALKDLGWILRSDIIWYKPNAMPSSVKNRPTTDHEYIFLFTKSKNYYYDADSIREPHRTFTDRSRMRGGRNHFFKRGGTPEQGKNKDNPNLHTARWDQAFHPKGRNRRTVWEIPLSKFPGLHFAVFPEELVELCILAGCPQDGIVLDPFIGSGTTALVAQKLNRNYIGIDLVEEYCKIAMERLRSQIPLHL